MPRYYRDIVPTSKEISLTNLGTILGWYSHHINWLTIWNTPLSDIGMMSEYNRYILANICAIFHIGWILVQYCTNMAVLLGSHWPLNVAQWEFCNSQMRNRETYSTHSFYVFKDYQLACFWSVETSTNRDCNRKLRSSIILRHRLHCRVQLYQYYSFITAAPQQIHPYVSQHRKRRKKSPNRFRHFEPILP